MAQVYKDIIRLTIDLKTGVKEAIAPIKQADNLSRVLRCQLINNGKPINLKGSQLLLYVVKADYKQCVINGVINESKTGIVDFELTEQSLILAEEIQCEIVKIDEGDVLLSFPIFKIGIDGALYDNGLVESTNEFSALTALISNVASWENRFVSECERIEGKFDKEVDSVKTSLLDKIGYGEGGVITEAMLSQKVKEMMTGGSVAVVDKDTILTENIVDGQVTVEKTDFVERGVNKFDGKFIKGYGLTGAFPNVVYSSVTGGVSAVFKATPTKTYTISKSNDTNRFGIALFADYPTAGVKPVRAILKSDTTLTQQTVTMTEEEKYIVIYLSGTNAVPSFLQIEEGTSKTEFVGYDMVKINLTQDSIPLITPTMTSFARPGKNLANPQFYMENTLLAGDPTALRLASGGGGGRVFVFKGEKGRTYTISRSNDGDRYGLGTSVKQPVIGDYLTRVINNNTSPWIEKTIQLQDDEEYIVVGITSTSQNIKLSQLQIELGNKKTSYSKYGSVQIDLESVNISSSQQTEKTKKVAWFGDSISELRSLPNLVSDLLMYNIYDCSFAGSVMTYRNGGAYEKLGFLRLTESIVSGDFTVQEQAIAEIEAGGGASNKRPNFNTLISLDFEEVDTAVVFLGTNDYGAGSGNLDNFKEGMRQAVKNILNAHPHIQFYFITPIWRANAQNNNGRGYNLIDLVNAEITVAKEFNMPVLDLYHNSGINEFNKSIYLQSDQLHQTARGDTLLAEKIAKFISSN